MKLTINDTTTAQIQLGYNDSIYGRIGRNSSGNYEFSSYENGGNLLFGTTGTTGSTTERVRIDSSGRVGIGTSLDSKSGISALQPIRWLAFTLSLALLVVQRLQSLMFKKVPRQERLRLQLEAVAAIQFQKDCVLIRRAV
jgi:hypothetical protein